MQKRLGFGILMLLGGFLISFVAHFSHGTAPDLIVVFSSIMALLGCIQLYISCQKIQKDLDVIEYLASFNQGDSQQAKLSYFAHEVRTPMHGIIGMLDLIENESDPDQTKRLIETARKASQNLLLVLNNNIDAAKLQKDELQLLSEAHNLADVCEHVVRLHAGNAQYKGLDFNLFLDPHLLDVDIEIDRSRLQQILNNLLGNAIKFTQKGSVKLWASLIKHDEHSIKVRFAVEDTGLGISKEDQAQLMKPFQQVGNNVRLQIEGSGIGLFISNEILHKMLSKLQIKSAEGQGSVFFFDLELPIVKTRQAMAALPGSSVSIMVSRGSTFELLTQYLNHWRFTYHRLTEWDDLLLNRSTQTIILDEAFAKEHISQLKQLLFSDKRRIIIIKEQSSLKNSMFAYDWKEFNVINKPILPSELIQQILKNKDLVSDHPHAENASNVYQQLLAFNEANPNFKILCVDDNHVNQLVIKKQLQTLGFSFIQMADNGQHALQMAKDTNFDAIFMDFNMPVLDGISATKILRKRGFTKPIVGITAQDLKNDNPDDNQMDTILGKPVNSDILAQCCLSIVSQHGSSAEVYHTLSTTPKPKPNLESKRILLYVPNHQTLGNNSVIDDTLQMLGISKNDIKVLSSQLIRQDDLEGVQKIIVDVSVNQYSQMRIARRLRKLGFDKTILALSPIESDILSNTFQHFGFDKGGTANTLRQLFQS
jgi:signal transduction histidine kinase/CheY-like chemotaxis protein